MRVLMGAVCLAVLLLVPQTTLATTWRVEQDGSGDFDDIQPAVDAAAEGDTILIGPGHYDQARSVLLPGWGQETDVYVFVDKEQLTFIGSDFSEVIIGPSEYYSVFAGPKCFASGSLTQAYRIENVTVQNSWDGIYDTGGALIAGCRMENCVGQGVFASATTGLQVVNCVFENCATGVFCIASCSGVRVSNCTFENSPVSLQNTTEVSIENCTMIDGSGAVQFDNSAGSVVDCVVSRMSSFGVAAISYSTVSIEYCDISVEAPAVIGQDESVVTVNSCRLEGGEAKTILVMAGTQFTLNNSDIYRNGDWFVRGAHWTHGDYTVLDFTNNYWHGASTQETIAAAIWDANDTDDLVVEIDFTPFSNESLPNEGASWGDVKAMYQGKR